MTVLKLLKSKTFRLLAIFGLLFAGTAILVTTYVGLNSNRLLDVWLKQTILAETRGLAEHLRSGGISRLTKVINSRIKGPGNSLYLLADGKRVPIAGNIRKVRGDLWNHKGRMEIVYERKGPDSLEMRHGVVHIFPFARGYRLIVGKDVEEQSQFINNIRYAVLSGLAFMILAGIFAGWLVTRNILNRIDDVTTTSRKIMSGDMSGRVPIDGSGDELDRLAVNLNAMLERIEQLMWGLKDVSSNIAHDLKTPLNRIRTRIEATLRNGEEGQYEDVLLKTIDESDELIRTFNALLSIAKLEAGNGSDNFALFDVQKIAEDVAELYEPLAEENNMELTVVEGNAVMSLVDRQLLGQALANLIENAIKYGGVENEDQNEPEQRGNITLQVKMTGERSDPEGAEMIYISVSDKGQGIARQDRDNALKRFGRLEKSRSKPGTGLGLSLVAAVAKQHEGELQLADNHPGLISRIIFPKKISQM